jgi:hypothetical protein
MNWQCCHDEARRIQLSPISFQLAPPSFSDRPGLQDNICDSLWQQVVQILYELPDKNWKKKVTIVLIFDLLMRSFFSLGDCGVCHSSLCLLVSGSYLKNQFSSPVMTQLRKSGSVLSRSSISGPHTHWIHQWSFELSNIDLDAWKPSHTWCLRLSYRDGPSRSPFIFHRFSPIYKAFVPLKYLITWYRIITKHFLNLFVGMGSALPQRDTKLDCTKLLKIFLLHFSDDVTKHTSTRTTTELLSFMLASSNLEWR